MKRGIKRHLQICVCGAAIALASSCVPVIEPQPTAEPRKGVDLIGINYSAVEQLIGNHQGDLSSDKPILVASIVDIDNLELSSTLGRLIAEQVGSRLAQMGYLVKELKLRGQLLVREQSGEFVLSRDIKRIRGKYDAQTIVAGTFASGNNVVYINLRLIRAEDARVVSSVDYTIPIDQNVFSLIDFDAFHTYSLNARFAR